jgi:flagellar motor switch protein FliN
MKKQNILLDQFFDEWAGEFARAIEMFSGEAAQVAWKRDASTVSATTESPANYLWWKQEFKGPEVFESWIGAPESAWSRLGGAMGEAAEASQQVFLDILCQAQKTTAALMSGHSAKPINCIGRKTEQGPPARTLGIAEITVTVGGTQLAPLIYAVDPEIANLLDESDALSPKSSGPGAGTNGPIYGPMLQKMLDLELPLCVVLGRAVMPIQEVLKVTSGSLIPLNQSVNEYVEVVIHGKVVARGEVMSFRGNYGIRIKEIMSPEGRMALSAK